MKITQHQLDRLGSTIETFKTSMSEIFEMPVNILKAESNIVDEDKVFVSLDFLIGETKDASKK